jgi:uncharacterized protein YecT (DUF1311 family)
VTAMRPSFLAANLMAFWVTSANLVAEPNSANLALVTAPSGDFRLTRASNGAIWIVSTKSVADHVVLPAVQIEVNTEAASSMNRVSSDSIEGQPECFVSPDERWIFVEVDTGGGNTTGILYQRTQDTSGGSETPRYEPASTNGFDHAAWDFVCEDHKLTDSDIGIPDKNGIWSKTLYFGAWSADSTRLLLRLGGTVGKPKEPEEGGPSQWKSNVLELCYFNTRTGAFELTDRLRKANSAQKSDTSGQAGQHVAESDAVLSAESVGQESPEPSVSDRFKHADAELNNTYKQLLTSLSPTEKAQLQKEEQLWLTKRDLFAVIHAWQSWSPFPNASRIEGMAIATEARVTELRKRLPAGAGS